jgi:hypothetical protein
VVNTGEASFDGFNETVTFLNIYSPQIDHCNGILRNSLVTGCYFFLIIKAFAINIRHIMTVQRTPLVGFIINMNN